MKKTDSTEITKAEEKVIKKTITDLFTQLQIQGDIALTVQGEGVDVVLETEDVGIVVGYHGEVLESLQLITSLTVSKKLGRFVRVSLEVGDYKKNRSDWLENITRQTKERALAENKEIPLPNLKSWERRIVHVLLQEDKEVISESVGEGRDRTLVIKPRI